MRPNRWRRGSCLSDDFRIARRTMGVVKLNIAFTAVYNLSGLSLAALGLIPPGDCRSRSVAASSRHFRELLQALATEMTGRPHGMRIR